MLQPMPPSADMAATEDAVNAAENEGGAQGFEKDEFIINSQKVPLLKKNVERIKKNFHVEIDLGLQAVEDVEIQWVSVQGLPDDRTMARSYIKALCSPGNILAFNFPDELYSTLSQPEVHARLEKQSDTAILFPSVGQAVIQGEDDLAVTLAMSAIEDIIQKYSDINIPDASSPTSARNSDDRLDRELRRLSSQNKELYGEEFDTETLSTLPGVVKRTIIKQYMDDSRQSSVDESSKPDSKADSSFSKDPDQTVPMTLIGCEEAMSISASGKGFVDLHPERKLIKPNDFKPPPVVDLHPSSQNSSLSLSLHLSDIPHKKELIDLTQDSPKSASSVPKRASPLGASASNEGSTSGSTNNIKSATGSASSSKPAPGQSLLSEAISFALNNGYTHEEIEEVQNDFGDVLTTAQFLQVLHTNRREKTQKHAFTVAELEAAHVPRLPEDRKVDIKEGQRSVIHKGKQAPLPSHTHGPKTKKGKLTPGGCEEKLPKAGKARQRNSRFSPTEENTEKMEVVNLSDDDDEGPVVKGSGSLPKPIHDALRHSPLSASKMKGKEDNSGGTSLVADYLNRLTQDYDEESGLGIDEVRKRNTARRALLQQALQYEKTITIDDDNSEESEDDEPDIQELSSGEWITVEKDGRQRIPKNVNTKQQSGTDNNKNRGFADKVAQETEPKGAKFTSNEIQPSRAWGRPLAAAAAGSSPVDTLDDFSIPVHGQNQGNASPQKPIRPQYNNSRNQQQWQQNRNPQFNQQRGQFNLRNGQNHPQQVPQYNRQQNPGALRYPAPSHPQRHVPPRMDQPSYSAGAGPAGTGENNKLHTNLRYIIIDGSNVAMTHGNHQVFSCKGIRICIDYFRRRGHKEVTAFVPQWRTHHPRPEYPIRDQHMLEELRKEGCLVFTPARRVPGKNIVCYDDKFVLRLAQETEGIVVSNDNYRDLWNEKREWREIIEYRLLMFSFVGDIFMAPEDPLGRDGPVLDQFLRKNNDFIPGNRHVQQGVNVETQPYNNRQPHPMGKVPRYQNPYHARPNHSQADNSTQYQQRPLQQAAQGQRQPVPYHGQGQPHQSQNYGPQGYANQGQGHPGQGQGHPGQGQFNQNPQGQGPRMQNPQDRPQRPVGTTDWMRKKLYTIFPDCEGKINQALNQLPQEMDINRIIEFMLEDD